MQIPGCHTPSHQRLLFRRVGEEPRNPHPNRFPHPTPTLPWCKTEKINRPVHNTDESIIGLRIPVRLLSLGSATYQVQIKAINISKDYTGQTTFEIKTPRRFIFKQSYFQETKILNALGNNSLVFLLANKILPVTFTSKQNKTEIICNMEEDLVIQDK